MIKHLNCICFLFFLCFFSQQDIKAQNSFASEVELKKQASTLFEDGSFEEAYPLYSQLLSLYPKSGSFNFRFGTCMLYSVDDKEKPLSYLEYASKQTDVEKEVYYYLGKAYHLNYRFDDAITQFQAFKKVASGSNVIKLDVDRQIEMCNNGKKLLRNLSDLIVLEKKDVTRLDFFRSYDISAIGGKLLVKPDEENFKTAIDKKKKEQSIIYLASNNNQIFFSSYGKNDKQGKDIYTIKKLPNGEWSQPQTLGSLINTKYDEDFPFLHPNGRVLYFCSKGHNSMGGFDIFKSTLNEENNMWSEPVNLDFPINTPDDDILYVTDANEKEAYFSSARGSLTGEIAVYHIKTERKPIDFAIIKGEFKKNREGQSLEAKITIKDIKDNSIIGIYNSNNETGEYLINLPNGGEFLFTVESIGFPIQSQIIKLAPQFQFKPLKQQLSYEVGTDKLIIKNLFDAIVDDSNYMLALNLIKEKSKMEISTFENTPFVPTKDTADNYFDAKEIVKNTEDNSTKINTKLSNTDIIKIAYDDAKEIDIEAKELKQKADIALVFANEKKEAAQDKAKEAAQLTADAALMQDQDKKNVALIEASETYKEAEQLNEETVIAFNLAKKIDLNAKSKEQEAILSKQYASDLESAVNSKNSTLAIAKLTEQQKILDDLSQKNSATDNLATSFKIDADNKQRQLNDAIQESADIKQEIADNKKVIETTKKEIEKTKDEKLKQGLIRQEEGLEEDIVSKEKDFSQNETKIEQLQKEYNGIKNEADLINNVIDLAKNGTYESAAEKVALIDKNKLEQDVNDLKKPNEFSSQPPQTSSEVKAIPVSLNPTEVATASKIEKEKTTNEISESNVKTSEIPKKTDSLSLNSNTNTGKTVTLNKQIESENSNLNHLNDSVAKNELPQKINGNENLSKEIPVHFTDSIIVVKSPTNNNIKNDFDKSKINNKAIDSTSLTETKAIKTNTKNSNELIALETQPKKDYLVEKKPTKLNDTIKSPPIPIVVNKKVKSIDEVSTKESIVASTLSDNSNSEKAKPILNIVEHFERRETAIYSESKPIPVNEKLPEGLIFKVQIGAFKNAIPQNLFKGITPITGETTPQGYIRYTAGMFINYTNADNIKNEIKGFGYKDAFVVAFFDGRRISINEAKNKLGDSLVNFNRPIQNNNTDASITELAFDNKGKTNNNIDNLVIENESTAEAQSVLTVGGLFYTIQVGVYSKPVSAKKLHNLNPLYSELAQNGNLRYNIGCYDNISRANEARKIVIDEGIKDAFIAVYFNGKRISMDDAKRIISEKEGVFANNINMNTLPILNTSFNQNTTNSTNQISANITKADVNQNDESKFNNQLPVRISNSNGIVYKVQIGAFKSEVPVVIANKFLTIAKKGITNYKDESGLTIYTVGEFKTYDEASLVKADVVKSGILDAFIVVYKEGRKISLNEGKTLINK